LYNNSNLIAVGFNPKKTYIFSDLNNSDTLYPIAVKIAKHSTFSTVKGIFGFNHETNPGMIFFPAMQAAPCFLPSELYGKETVCLIPAAIDQDPYWRLTRDVANKIGHYKPVQIHCKFLPGLGKGGKMSSSDSGTAIYTTDSPDRVKKKVWNSFTGGGGSLKEHREKGGKPQICSVYQYFLYLFEESDERLAELIKSCKIGETICGDCKTVLTERVTRFLLEHQKKREKAKDAVEEFFITR